MKRELTLDSPVVAITSVGSGGESVDYLVIAACENGDAWGKRADTGEWERLEPRFD